MVFQPDPRLNFEVIDTHQPGNLEYKKDEQNQSKLCILLFNQQDLGINAGGTVNSIGSIEALAKSVEYQLLPVGFLSPGPPPVYMVCDIISAAHGWLLLDTSAESIVSLLLFSRPLLLSNRIILGQSVCRCPNLDEYELDYAYSAVLIMTCLYLMILLFKKADENSEMVAPAATLPQTSGELMDITRLVAKHVCNLDDDPPIPLPDSYVHNLCLVYAAMQTIFRGETISPFPLPGCAGNRKPILGNKLVPICVTLKKVVLMHLPKQLDYAYDAELTSKKSVSILRYYRYGVSFDKLLRISSLSKRVQMRQLSKESRIKIFQSRLGRLKNICHNYRVLDANESWSPDELERDYHDLAPVNMEIYNKQGLPLINGKSQVEIGMDYKENSQYFNDDGEDLQTEIKNSRTACRYNVLPRETLKNPFFVLNPGGSTEPGACCAPYEFRLHSDSRDFNKIKRMQNDSTSHYEFIVDPAKSQHIAGDMVIVFNWNVAVPGTTGTFLRCLDGHGVKGDTPIVTTKSPKHNKTGIVGLMDRFHKSSRKKTDKQRSLRESGSTRHRGLRSTEHMIISLNTTWTSLASDVTDKIKNSAEFPLTELYNCMGGQVLPRQKRITIHRDKLGLTPRLRDILPPNFAICLTFEIVPLFDVPEDNPVAIHESPQHRRQHSAITATRFDIGSESLGFQTPRLQVNDDVVADIQNSAPHDVMIVEFDDTDVAVDVGPSTATSIYDLPWDSSVHVEPPTSSPPEPKTPTSKHQRRATNIWKMSKKAGKNLQSAFVSTLEAKDVSKNQSTVTKMGLSVPGVKGPDENQQPHVGMNSKGFVGCLPRDLTNKIDKLTQEDPVSSPMLHDSFIRKVDPELSERFRRLNVGRLPVHHYDLIGLKALLKYHPLYPQRRHINALQKCRYSHEDVVLSLKLSNNRHWEALQLLTLLAAIRLDSEINRGDSSANEFANMLADFDVRDQEHEWQLAAVDIHPVVDPEISILQPESAISESFLQAQSQLSQMLVNRMGTVDIRSPEIKTWRTSPKQLFRWHGPYEAKCRGLGLGTPPGPPPYWRVTEAFECLPRGPGLGTPPGPPPMARYDFEQMKGGKRKLGGFAPIGKKIYWKGLRGVENTVFGEMNDTDAAEEIMDYITDTAVLNEVFLKPTNVVKPTTEKFKVEKDTILDAKRAQNCSIILSRIPSPDVLVWNMKRLLLLPEYSDVWGKAEIIMLNEDELRSLNLYVAKNGVTNLREMPERALLPFVKDPLLVNGVRMLFAIRENVYDEMLGLWGKIKALSAFVQEVTHSVKFKQTLSIILKWGNYINHGTRSAQSRPTSGFTMESLLKLSDFRSGNNSTITSLHFLAIHMMIPPMEQLNLDRLAEDFTTLDSVLRITDDSLNASSERLRMAVEDIKECGDYSDTLFSKMIPPNDEDEISIYEESLEYLSKSYHDVSQLNRRLPSVGDSPLNKKLKSWKSQEHISMTSEKSLDTNIPLEMKIAQNWESWEDTVTECIDKLCCLKEAVVAKVTESAKFFGMEAAMKSEFRLEDFINTMNIYVKKFDSVVKEIHSSPSKFTQLIKSPDGKQFLLDMYGGQASYMNSSRHHRTIDVRDKKNDKQMEQRSVSQAKQVTGILRSNKSIENIANKNPNIRFDADGIGLSSFSSDSESVIKEVSNTQIDTQEIGGSEASSSTDSDEQYPFAELKPAISHRLKPDFVDQRQADESLFLPRTMTNKNVRYAPHPRKTSQRQTKRPNHLRSVSTHARPVNAPLPNLHFLKETSQRLDPFDEETWREI